MNINSLDELLHDQLKDLFSAESQLVKALPTMAKAASSSELKIAIEEDLGQTKTHVERLETIGERLGVKLSGKRCAAMEGLMEEGKEVLDTKGDEPILDAAIIAAAQRVEHYEISAYGTARTMAEQLGLDDAASLLQETLDEEETTDTRLSEIVENEIYPLIADNGSSRGARGDHMEKARRGQSGRSV